ncbi:hypothetical protein [Methylophaga sp. OBS3]|uniref:hypothetical protein n=1 Tax=Methylophaga sp. OBS3 TaxID=2991934 RepID=UPI00225A7A01|nr:hypothetical protein [Methylophaga sp. OBS3]MCX4189371.1 hypothetical protein [Methylophaga sp. OBS3]
MWRTIVAHIYVIIMATVVVMTGNILADKFGDGIVNFLSGLGNQAAQEKANIEQGVKDWNKNMLD